MEGPRSPSEAEFPQVLEFLHAQLRPNAGWSLEKEYPTALTKTNLHNMRIITDETRVVSHAVLKPLILKTPNAAYKVGAIGSVVTDESHRNQGFSKQILENCLEEARKQECEIAILWTNLYDFYRKLGFELSGSEISFLFENEFPAPRGDLKYITGAKVSADSIHRLYCQHPTGTVRTLEDTKKFLSIPNTQIYTAWNPDGTLASYAIEGKGADLTNYIHEWGGDVPSLISLMSYIRREKKAGVTLIAPASAQNLRRQLTPLATVVNEGFLGMIKILDYESVMTKVKRVARGLGHQDFVFEKRGDEFVIGLGQDLLAIADEKDVVKVIFGPLKEIPQLSFLPLPLWFWGWDSV